MTQIAAEVWRGDTVESVHEADLAVVLADEPQPGRILATWGNPFAPVYLRSAAKPIQAAGSFALGLDRLGVEPGSRHLAIMAASHGATPDQISAVRDLLALAGLDESALDCGSHEPLSRAGRDALGGAAPTSICGNCSGKHAGMMAACLAQGWPVAGYRQPDHPLQRHLRADFARVMGLASAELGSGVDGCGVPVWAVALPRVAHAFARLCEGDLAPVGQAMRAHPELVGPPEGFNVRLMAALPEVVAKNGAEGVFCLGLPERRIGLALKVRDGSHRAVPSLVLSILADLGLPTPDDLAEYVAPEIRNLHGEIVGQVRAVRRLAPPIDL
ncbi:MAG: asparaginase [Armatimonadetes bacterium]|nr:asparaginase [Armatimonadota bacterium]